MRKIKAFSAVLAAVLALSMVMSLVASAATRVVYKEIGDTAKSQEWYAIVPEGVDADYGAKEDTLADGETKGSVIYMDLKANEEGDLAAFVYEDIAGLEVGRGYTLTFKAKANTAGAWLGAAVGDVANAASYAQAEFEAAEAGKWFDVTVYFVAEKNTADVIIGMTDVAEFAFYGFDLVLDKDILANAANPEVAPIVNGGWGSEPDTVLSWGGQYINGGGRVTVREKKTVTIDGVETTVVHLGSNGSDVTQVSNRFGTFDLKPNTSYIIKVVASGKRGSVASSDGRLNVISCTADPDAKVITMQDTDDWVTYYLPITTNSTTNKDVYVRVGHNKAGDGWAGNDYNLYVADLEIYEVEADKYDVLKGAGAFAPITRSEWNWASGLVNAWNAGIESDKNVTRTATAYGAEIVDGKLAAGVEFTSVANADEVNAVYGRFGAFDLAANTEYKISFLADIVDPAVDAVNDCGYREVKIGNELIGTLKAGDADGLKAYSYTYTTGDAATGLYLEFAHPANNWQEKGYSLKIYDLKIVPTTLPEEDEEPAGLVDVLNGAASTKPTAANVKRKSWGWAEGNNCWKFRGESGDNRDAGPQVIYDEVEIGGVTLGGLTLKGQSHTDVPLSMKYAVELEPNTDYVAKFYAKSTPNNTFRFSYSAATHGDDNTKKVNVLRVSTLTEYTYKFTTGADTAGAHFQFISQSGDGERFKGEDQITSIIGLKVYKAPKLNVNDKDVLEGAAMPGNAKIDLGDGDTWENDTPVPAEPAYHGVAPTMWGTQKRAIILADVDGSAQWVLSCVSASKTASSQYDNRFGTFDLTANTKYVARVKAKIAEGFNNQTNGTNLGISFNNDTKTPDVVMKADGKWNEYIYEFTTGDDASDLILYVGPHNNDDRYVCNFDMQIAALEIFTAEDYEEMLLEEELAKYTEPTFGNMNPDYFAEVEEIPDPPATGAVAVPVVAAVLAVASGVVVYKRKK